MGCRMHLIVLIEGNWHLSETYHRPIRAKEGDEECVRGEGRRGPISGCELQALEWPAHSFHAQAKQLLYFFYLLNFFDLF